VLKTYSRTAGMLILSILLPGPWAWGLGQRPPTEPTQVVTVGKPAPDFRLSDPGGREISLSQFRGKVVFLNFWASWCPPCRAEMPSMERLNEVYGSKNFAMVAVNTENDPGAVRRFLEKNPHSFTVLLDVDGRVHQTYRVFKFPETFLLDREGRIVEHYIGARDWSAVEFLKKIGDMVEGKTL